jgi:hypothetical protein
MYTQITGTHENKPAITVEFYDSGISLLYLEGTEPFIRRDLTLEEAQRVIVKAGYSIKIETIS